MDSNRVGDMLSTHCVTSLLPNTFPHILIDTEMIHDIRSAGTACLSVIYKEFQPGEDAPILEEFQHLDQAQASMFTHNIDSRIGENIKSGQSSSGEKGSNLTAAQIRRKAQNRAAQRAFRERRVRYVRGLEMKISALESTCHSLRSENEGLELSLQMIRTANEALRIDNYRILLDPSRAVFIRGSQPATLSFDEEKSMGNGDRMHHAKSLDTANITAGQKDEDEEILAAQAWDWIRSHPNVEQGLVEIADVYERLNRAAKWTTSGLVFKKSTVWRAIQGPRYSHLS